MFYYLFTYYNQIPGARLVTYISFRAIVAAGLAFFISMYFGKHFIAFMRRHNISEEQRDAKSDPFGVQKQGVPTMGGLIIIAGKGHEDYQIIKGVKHHFDDHEIVKANL